VIARAEPQSVSSASASTCAGRSRFTSTRIRHVEAGNYRVTGDLTIRDVTP